MYCGSGVRQESGDLSNTKIAYEVYEEKSSFIYVMDTDGSNPVCLGKGYNPAWSPFLNSMRKNKKK